MCVYSIYFSYCYTNELRYNNNNRLSLMIIYILLKFVDLSCSSILYCHHLCGSGIVYFPSCPGGW